MDYDQVFEMLKLESSQAVDKQTLIDLFFHMKVDESQPHFFRLLLVQLNAFKQEVISKTGTTIKQTSSASSSSPTSSSRTSVSTTSSTYPFNPDLQSLRPLKEDRLHLRRVHRGTQLTQQYQNSADYKAKNDQQKADILKQIRYDFQFVKTFQGEVTCKEFYQIMTLEQN